MGRGGMIEREYSQDVAMRIDKEVELIMNTQLERARVLLERHKPVLDAIAIELMRTESLEREAFEKLLTLHGIKPKTKMGEEVYIAPPAKSIEKVEKSEKTEAEQVSSEPQSAVIVTSDVVVRDTGEADTTKHNRKKDKHR